MNPLANVIYRRIAIEGERFSNNLHNWTAPVLQQFISQGSSYMAVVLGRALQWTKHALDERAFLDYAIPWFDSDDPIDLNALDKFDGYMGLDKLSDGMIGLRAYKNAITDLIPDFRTCDARDLVKLQQQGFNRLSRMIKEGKINGVGSWLFLGPFKIIIVVENRLWADPNIDSIILPSGREVVRGIIRFHNEAQSLCNFDLNWLNEEERSLKIGYANEQLIHGEFVRIANAVNTRANHVNGAFYLYGSREIDF